MNQFHSNYFNGCKLDEEDCATKSEIIVSFGAHRKAIEKPPSVLSIKNTIATQTGTTPNIKPILLDLNNLQDDNDCPYGCQADVFVTVRHRPGCQHKMQQVFSIGTKNFDYIGKGTYRYQMEGEEGSELNCQSYYKQKCDEFSQRCDNLLDRLSLTNAVVNTFEKSTEQIVTHGTVYHVIDKYSFHNELGNEQIKRTISEKLTKSEIDLYEYDFIN